MGGNRNHRFGFEFVKIMEGGALRAKARFTCVECGAIFDAQLKSGGSVNPEGIANRARLAGWEADAHRANRSICPDCLKPPPEKESTMAANLPPQSVVPIRTPPAVTQPTGDQRMKIRGLLDKHFDDAAGHYLDGMSDQKIAEAVNVSRVTVEQVREAAYGSIKINPELLAVMAEIASLGTAIEGQQRGLDVIKERHAALIERAKNVGVL